ncbi:MAG: TRAP transporter small permease subunit [Rhodocyclaceae bacterium]|nr:TRAP transporter small permease subunit [Rhodocyclaceae bacterium]
MQDAMELEGLARRADQASGALCRFVDKVCVGIMILLVLDVWLGVFARYVVPLPITFMEEAARYLMIWVALLAVSSGIARREHIGVQMLFVHLPPTARRLLLALVDALAIAFFVVLLWYGVGMVERGGRVSTMIYGLSKAVPFAAVPVSAALAALQLILVAVRDQARLSRNPDVVVCP